LLAINTVNLRVCKVSANKTFRGLRGLCEIYTHGALAQILVNSISLENAVNNARKEVRIPPILMDLIPQYLSNRRLEITTLDSALAEKNFETIQSIGHKLKGNAGSYGFYELTALGDALEKAGKEMNLDLAQNTLTTYREYIESVYVLPL
jgi:HPt (histidine-containing phosphotransfer) domain-containing protein